MHAIFPPGRSGANLLASMGQRFTHFSTPTGVANPFGSHLKSPDYSRAGRLTDDLYRISSRHYERYCKVTISESQRLAPVTLAKAREVLEKIAQERWASFYLFRGFLRTPLGSIVHHVEENDKGRPVIGRQDPSNRLPKVVSPEFMAEWHVLMDKWAGYVWLLEKYPSVSQHMLKDVFLDPTFEPLVKARDMARSVAAQNEARSAIDEIAAELGVM